MGAAPAAHDCSKALRNFLLNCSSLKNLLLYHFWQSYSIAHAHVGAAWSKYSLALVDPNLRLEWQTLTPPQKCDTMSRSQLNTWPFDLSLAQDFVLLCGVQDKCTSVWKGLETVKKQNSFSIIWNVMKFLLEGILKLKTTLESRRSVHARLI